MQFRVFVSATGKLDDIRVIKYYGDPRLVTLMLNYARAQWRFRPWLVDGHAIPYFLEETPVFVADSKDSDLHRAGYEIGGVSLGDILLRYGKSLDDNAK